MAALQRDRLASWHTSPVGLTVSSGQNIHERDTNCNTEGESCTLQKHNPDQLANKCMESVSATTIYLPQRALQKHRCITVISHTFPPSLHFYFFHAKIHPDIIGFLAFTSFHAQVPVTGYALTYIFHTIPIPTSPQQSSRRNQQVTAMNVWRL